MQSAARAKQKTETTPQRVKDYRFLKLVKAVVGPDEFTSQSLVGLMSINPKAGTSSITAGLGAELATYTDKPILVAKAEELKMVRADDLVRMSQFLQRTRERKLLSFQYFHHDPRILEDTRLAAKRGYSPQTIRAAMKAMSLVFRHVLIDFPSLKEAPEYLLMTPLVEGIVLIAEAGKTTKEQILWSTKSIEAAGGKVMGIFVNKRRYPVPEFIHKWL
jgi:hypothetical protein